MSVLVTGGLGYIGSHTCVELMNAGIDVVVVDNLYNCKKSSYDRIKALVGRDFPFYECDIRDFDGLQNVFKNEDIDSVIHFAGLKAVGESCVKPLEYFDNNHSGKIINLFFSQLETVKDFVVSDLQALIRLPLSFIIISGYLFTVHPLLGFIAVFSSVLQLLSSFVFRKKYESACDDVRITTNNSLDNQGAPDKNRLSCGNRCVCVPYYQRRYRSKRPYSIYNAAFKGV